jgi:hypothetical protein
MSKFNKVLKWLRKEFDQMSFSFLLVYLFLAFWVVFVDAAITQSFFDLVIRVFFEMTGILAVVEMLKRLFPHFKWEDYIGGS